MVGFFARIPPLNEETVNIMKKISTVLALMSVITLSSCTHGNEQISSISPQDQLKSSVFAYATSGDYRATGGLENNPGSSILFYNPKNKEWTDVATNGLEYSTFDYDGENLYYADYNHDYILNRESLNTISHEDHLAPRLTFIFSIPPSAGGGMVALANQGVVDDGKGYLFDVIVTQGEKRTVYPLNHYVSGATQCEDGSIWALTDPYLTSNESGYGPADAPQQFLKLFPDFNADPIATVSHDKRYVSGNDLECSDGVLYTVIDTFKPEITESMGGGPGDHDGSRLISYDTKTGTTDSRELTGDWSIRRTDEMWVNQLADKHIYNGNLYWTSGTGDVVRTNLKTAQNTTIFKLQGVDLTKESEGFIYFIDKYMFQSIPYYGKDGNLYRYNLETGEMESHVKIPDYKNVDKKHQFPTDFIITDLEAALKLQ